jgi:hypothetical protein
MRSMAAPLLRSGRRYETMETNNSTLWGEAMEAVRDQAAAGRGHGGRGEQAVATAVERE